MTGIEPVASSLPRKRSTPELHRLLKQPICSLTIDLSATCIHQILKKFERCFFRNTSFYFSLSGRRDSNPRPLAWKANALSAELLPLVFIFVTPFVSFLWGEQDSNLRSHKTAELQSAPVGRFGISPKIKSRWRDSNPRPADYKSAALAS